MRSGVDSEAPRLRSGLKYCAGIFLVVRLGVWILSSFGVGLIPPLRSIPGPGWHQIFVSLDRLDADWFLRIADGGYRIGDPSAAFYPAYPLAIKAVSILTLGRPLLAALIVSNVAFFGSLVFLYSLTVLEFSEDIARKAVLYVAIFPTSFFFLAPYSESPFLLFVVVSFWGARQRRWWVAGIAGALAAATRSLGIVLLPALLIEVFQQRREEPDRSPIPGVAAALSVAVGPLAYFTYWQLKASRFLAPLDAQKDWHRRLEFPLVTLGQAFKDAVSNVGDYRHGYWMIDAIFVIVFLVIGIAGVRRLRPAYSVFLWASLLIPLAYPYPPRPLLSMPRFVIVLFPAFWVTALASSRRTHLHSAILVASGIGYGLLAVLFMNWYPLF